MKVANAVDSLLEEELSDFIRDLDPNGRYFLPLKGPKCIVDPKHLSSCGPYQSTDPVNQPLYRGYLVQYGGPTLAKTVDQTPPTLQIAFKWLEHLVKGLTLLHHNRVVHMDIKSANVVIHNGLPKLIDFGLSNFINHTSTYDVTGYYELYPAFYTVMNVGVDTDLEQVYYDHEHLAQQYDKYYVKGGPNDYIAKLYSMRHKKVGQYFETVVKPNLTKVDVFMLFSMFYYEILERFRDKLMAENETLYKHLDLLTKRCRDIHYQDQYNIDDVNEYLRLLSMQMTIPRTT